MSKIYILTYDFKSSSSFFNIDDKVKTEIEKDINSIFEIDSQRLNLIKEDAIKKFPNFRDDNKKKILKFYENTSILKNRIKLMKEKNSFKINEINSVIDVIREEYIIKEYINWMDAKRILLLEELYKKMDLIAKMSKDLKLTSKVFGRFWDLSYRDLYNMDMDFIYKMQKLMQERDYIIKISELLGRASSASNEYEEHLIKEMKYIHSNKKFIYSPENLVGITQGNNIPDLLPLYLSFWNNDKTKKIFKLQYSEKKLLQFKKESKVLDEIETFRTERQLKNNSKGPFILCIDTSGSMHGEPEIMAKAFSLAFINIANKENRKCFIINFSTNTIEFDASDLASSWEELYDFLSKSFGGGTDINSAVGGALNKLEENDYKNADVILISDLIINSLGENFNLRIIDSKKKGVKWHSLTIGNSYNKLSTKFLDNNWIFDGSKESINKIIADLNKNI